jgi:hypothetical protein
LLLVFRINSLSCLEVGKHDVRVIVDIEQVKLTGITDAEVRHKALHVQHGVLVDTSDSLDFVPCFTGECKVLLVSLPISFEF